VYTKLREIWSETRRVQVTWCTFCLCLKHRLRVSLKPSCSCRTHSRESALTHTTWETIGSLIIFAMGVFTRHIDQRTPCVLNKGDCTAGRLVEFTQVVATGRSRILFIHCVLQHCSNGFVLLKLPAEPKYVRRIKC
jgi:hypothetical protein